MVAKCPAIRNRLNTSSINPILLSKTIQKVDKCMTRLQEIQFTVTGGTKFISGAALSQSSSRGYMRTLRCKQESMRMKTVAAQRSPASKFPEKSNVGDWRTMSLLAMLISETVAEILQASKLFSEPSITSTEIDQKTPDNDSRNRKFENLEMRAKRAKEKQLSSRTLRLEYGSPVLRRARSRLSFETTSQLNMRKASTNMTGARPSVSVNRISPKNRPWRKKVLFPNPLFRPTPPASTHQKSSYKTRSPIIARPSKTPPKFLIKYQNTSLRSHLYPR